MSKERYEIDEQTGEILDNHFVLTPEDIVDRLNYLEEQLKNAIVPKFKIGQEVYKVYTPNQKYPFEFKIIGFKITKSKGEDNIFYNVEEDGFDMGWYPDEILFATKEEALAKLEELKG